MANRAFGIHCCCADCEACSADRPDSLTVTIAGGSVVEDSDPMHVGQTGIDCACEDALAGVFVADFSANVDAGDIPAQLLAIINSNSGTACKYLWADSETEFTCDNPPAPTDPCVWTPPDEPCSESPFPAVACLRTLVAPESPWNCTPTNCLGTEEIDGTCTGPDDTCEYTTEDQNTLDNPPQSEWTCDEVDSTYTDRIVEVWLYRAASTNRPVVGVVVRYSWSDGGSPVEHVSYGAAYLDADTGVTSVDCTAISATVSMNAGESEGEPDPDHGHCAVSGNITVEAA